MMQQETKLVKKFDQDEDKRLNREERQAAREFLQKERAGGRGTRGFGRPWFGGRKADSAPPSGEKLSPADAPAYPEAPLYEPNTLRTFFLDFENADWDKELTDFHNTDVEIPATLTVDGKTYPEVGVHYRGMSSYAMVGEGEKRSLNLSLDFARKNQNIGGYRTLNLLNSHGDPTFLRAVLFMQIARDYIPAPKANLVRVVINGEDWGIYASLQQFNKDFANDWFGTTKGARWKVPGSPGGRGNLAYLGDEVSAYKEFYEIKSKDEQESWAALIKLCKVLNETPAHKLEQAIAPLLDIDGALKFLALENALINNDGYWVRTSDYDLYQDVQGRFHIIPHDANETFSLPGGAGFGGGPGGPGGPGGFGPGVFIAPQILSQADRNGDEELARAEFTALAEAWFDKLDPDKTGTVDQDQLSRHLHEILPPPPGFGPPPGDLPPGGAPRFEGGPGGGNPAQMMAAGLLTAWDGDKNGSVTRQELKGAFAQWFEEWDKDQDEALDEEQLRAGLSASLQPPGIGRPGRRFGGPGGRGGFGGPGGGNRVNGVELDPLAAAQDPGKPLISKLLAVPSLRTRYLGYVRDIAERWLDWNQLGPVARQYHALIAEKVKKDTRKLDSYEAFVAGLEGGLASEGGRPGGGKISLKNFAEQRRAYLLDHPEVKKVESRH